VSPLRFKLTLSSSTSSVLTYCQNDNELTIHITYMELVFVFVTSMFFLSV